jgi:four helix bundle protein
MSNASTYGCVRSQGFEKLEVYRLAAQLSDEFRGAVRRWEKADVWSSGIQAMRAADSIGANIAEAFGRGTRPDQTRFLFIARGSAFEFQHWIARAEARDLPCPPKARERADRVGRMLNGLIRSLPRDVRA